jgi:hypothetical protein
MGFIDHHHQFRLSLSPLLPSLSVVLKLLEVENEDLDVPLGIPVFLDLTIPGIESTLRAHD